MGKGANFEREVCKLLGLWWTDGDRDDVFWRTSNSGGRATVRQRKRQGTFGQYGDIQATDPIGQPLIDFCCMELKRGYGHTSVADVLDCEPHQAKQQWETWIEQAYEEYRLAGSCGWVLITRRNRRQPIIYLPSNLFKLLRRVGSKLYAARPLFKMYPMLKNSATSPFEDIAIYATTLSEFMILVTPDDIKGALLASRTKED